MLVRCSVCRGQKKIKGLGCMLKKCQDCSGAGYVEQEQLEQDEQDKILDTHHELDVDVDKSKTRRKGNPHWRKKDASE